jgi:hypothetical protein
MQKLECDLCGNEERFTIEGGIYIDGYGNFEFDAWDYDKGSPILCGECVMSVDRDIIPDGFKIKGDPLDDSVVEELIDLIVDIESVAYYEANVLRSELTPSAIGEVWDNSNHVKEEVRKVSISCPECGETIEQEE